MRRAILATTCSCTLLLAALPGCRRAEETKSPPDRTGAIDGPSQAGSVPGPPLKARGGKPIDTAFIAASFPAAAVIHPARIARSPLAEALLKEAPVASWLGKMGIDVSTIDEVVILVPAPAKGGPDPRKDLPCFIVRFSKPMVAKELAAKFFAAVLPQFAELQEVRFEGRACCRVVAAPWVLVHAPTDRTLLVAPEDHLRAMLAEPKARGPLADRLAAADSDHDAILAVAAEPVRSLVQEGVQDARRHAPPPVVPIAEGIDVLQGGTLALDLTGETLLAAEFQASPAAAAEKIERAIRQAQEMAKKEWGTARAQMPRPILDRYGPALELAVQAFGSLQMDRQGDRVTASAKRPEGLEKVLRELVLGRAQ